MAIITGTSWDDVLSGTFASDDISGLNGNDTLTDDQGGDDRLYGGDGQDNLRVTRNSWNAPGTTAILLDGGTGNDRLELRSDSVNQKISGTLAGGAGDDRMTVFGFVSATIDAGEGDDVLSLTVAVPETLVITLGAGRDTINLGAYFGILPAAGAWTITDFAVGNAGDSLNLSGWLNLILLGWDAYNPFGGGYLRLVQAGADTLVQVDIDAAGSANGWATLLTLQNVTATAVTAANLAGYGQDGGPAVGITITGTTADEGLAGTVGGDTIYGNGGRDYITGDAGDDVIYIGADASSAYGGSQNDTIFGGGGDDYLDGGAGDDTLSGGGGDDWLTTDAGGSDVLDGDDGNDRFDLDCRDSVGNLVANGGNGNDVFGVGGTNAGLITLSGGSGDDSFTITGSTGTYLLSFGTGSDQLRISSTFDRSGANVWDGEAFIPTITITDVTAADRIDFDDVLEFGLTGWDGVTNPLATGHMRLIQDGANARLQIDRDGGANGFVDFILFQNVVAANLTTVNLSGLPATGAAPPGLTLAGSNTLYGSSGADTIVMQGYWNYAQGGAGNDVIEGNGNTLFWGGTGNDQLTGTGDDNSLYGGAGNDVMVAIGVFADLDGGSGNDRLDASATTDAAFLIGGPGYDTVIGGYGPDQILIEDSDYVDGGAGDDSADISFETSTTGVTIDLRPLWSGGVGIIGAGQIRNVEYIPTVRGSNLADVINLAGYGGDSNIFANGGDDFVEAGQGSDFLDGGDGKDQLIGNDGSDVLDGGSGDDTLFGGGGSDGLIGGAGSDLLVGGAGDDTLRAADPEAAAGVIDRLYGGDGDDLFYVDGTSDIVFENAGEGFDQVVTDSGYYLWDNIEGLVLNDLFDGRSNDFFGVGNALDNGIFGNEGNNLLIAGAGNDEVDGGKGNDLLFGEDGNDLLAGSDGIDYIVGGAGNDTLDGGRQADAIYGGDGDDTLIAGPGFVTDILVGGDGNDILWGRELYGTGGDYDLMDGGAGNDIYYVDTPDDLTFEAAGGGIDTVYASISGAGYYLYAHTENLVLEGRTPFGVGNELDNRLTGNQEDNYLLGGLGNDILEGKSGKDVLFGQAGADVFLFSFRSGADVIADFEDGTDKIQISRYDFTSFEQLKANMTEYGGTTAINFGFGDFIVINGVANAQLSAADFLFG